MIRERIDVGHFRIADHDVDEIGVGAHVLRFADEDHDRGGAAGAADLHQLFLRLAACTPEQRYHDCDGARGDRPPIGGTDFFTHDANPEFFDIRILVGRLVSSG